MNVKIDTKEKFCEITPLDSAITANMAAKWWEMLLGFQEKPTPHVVLNMSKVSDMDEEACHKLAAIQQSFYEKNLSFIICCFQPQIERLLDTLDLLEFMNVTPSQSEAWDIIHMEEIERELLDDENF